MGGGWILSRSSVLQGRPLNEKFCFETASSLMFTRTPCGEERVYFIDKNNAGGEGFGKGEESPNKFFRFTQLMERSATKGYKMKLSICKQCLHILKSVKTQILKRKSTSTL